MSPGDMALGMYPVRVSRPNWFGVITEMTVVLGLAGAVLFLAHWRPFSHLVPLSQAYLLLALAASGSGAAAAIAAHLSTKLSIASPVRGFSCPLAIYAILLMPLSVMSTQAGAAAVCAANFSASMMFLAFSALGLRARPTQWGSGWCGVCYAIIGAVAMAAATAVPPVHAFFFTSSATLSRLVVVGWGIVAVLFVIRGVMRSQTLTWRIGLGLAVIAIAHLLRAVGEATGPYLPFAALRLLGTLVLLFALAAHIYAVSNQEAARRELELRRVKAAEEAAAERDHEMRNVLTGLSGAAYLIGSSPGGQVPAELSSAVQTELERLRTLLERSADESPSGGASVEEVLTRLVMLRVAAGANVALNVESGLRVAVPSAKLAQVVTNLLVNCSRHAPGANVWVRAGRRAGKARIEIVDDGPGLAHGTASRAGGRGIPVSARLLAEHGGTLYTLPVPRGCAVVIEVPLERRLDEMIRGQRSGDRMPEMGAA